MVYVMIGDLIAYLPQIKKIIITKHADDLAISPWLLWTSTSVAQILYYIWIQDIMLILSESACMLSNITILILSIVYGNSRKNKKTDP